MKAGKLNYQQAQSREEARAQHAAASGTAKYMAGGQTLMPMMNLRLAFADQVIDVSRIADLRESRMEVGRLLIGAAVTHAMVEDGKVEDCARGYLRHVAGGIAYRSVRNRGTMGGSLAHADPAADWPTALLALDASVVIENEAGEREMPLAQFQLGLMETALTEGELLKGILISPLSEQGRWSYLKFCHKVGEFAHSIGAVVIDPTQDRYQVVLGAVSDKPLKMEGVAQRLRGGISMAEAGSAAFMTVIEQDILSGTSLTADAYEFQVHKTIIKRAVLEALSK
jgi:carbon-monoxide dehydrogenase medium subunit